MDKEVLSRVIPNVLEVFCTNAESIPEAERKKYINAAVLKSV